LEVSSELIKKNSANDIVDGRIKDVLEIIKIAEYAVGREE